MSSKLSLDDRLPKFHTMGTFRLVVCHALKVSERCTTFLEYNSVGRLHLIGATTTVAWF